MMNKNILKNTRKRLITINMMVVGIVFIVFALFIYKFFYDLTYNGVDKDLQMQMQKTENDLIHGERNPIPNRDDIHMMSKGSLVYVWENGTIIKSYPYDITNYMKPYEKSKNVKEGIISYEYEGSSFREFKKVSGPYTIEIIKLVDIEEGLLAKLRHVLIISAVIACAVIFIASKFLTRKSLEPIEESWKTQALFVQDASHELRTPLTIIFSKIESIIKRPSNSVEDEMKNLTIVMKEVRRLNKLVSDVLKLTKEDAIVTINKSEIDLKSMVYDITEQYEDICELQHKKLEFEYKSKDKIIFSDKEKLRQILIILIDNAIKYTNNEDTIKVTIYDENTNIIIDVLDTGIGIKNEDLSQIFNRFFRASSQRESNRDGAGIGLSIAKVLVSNLNRKISAISKYGEGSTFSLSIPKK